MATDTTLSDNELKALAYFAVGVSSEGSVAGNDVSNRLSFAGSMHDGKLHPVGNSGYSFGTLQTDLGQHPETAPSLVSAYQAWAISAHPNWVLNKDQEAQTISDLGRDGHTVQQDKGRPLDPTVKSHLDAFLKSDNGISFVHEHDVSQVNLITREPQGKDHGSAVTQLQTTSLYQHANTDDQARFATIMLKLENQSGHAYYPRILKGIENGSLHNVEEVKNQVAGLIPEKHGKPSYIESGMDHALNGTEAFLALRNAAPGSPQHDAWKSVIADPLVNPAKVNDNASVSADYKTVKDQFLHAGTEKSVQQDHVHSTLHQGMRGDDVKHAQTELHDLGYLQANPNGRFGPATKAATEDFQRAQGLDPGGKIGPSTQQHLDSAVRDKQIDSMTAPNITQFRDFSDPSHPQNALYCTLKDGFPPGTSPERLSEATAACYMSGIKQPDDLGNVTGINGHIVFESNAAIPKNAILDNTQPAPGVQQTMQNVQNFDQAQAQSMAQVNSQIATQNAQAPQGPTPGGR